MDFSSTHELKLVSKFEINRITRKLIRAILRFRFSFPPPTMYRNNIWKLCLYIDISTSFRFSEISVECPVHSWSLSLNSVNISAKTDGDQSPCCRQYNYLVIIRQSLDNNQTLIWSHWAVTKQSQIVIGFFYDHIDQRNCLGTMPKWLYI